MVQRYVALLRGINVGTAKRLAMADLRAALEGAGLERVTTLLQSGNVVFDADERPTGAALEDAIADATGVRAKVVVIDAALFRRIAADNPLADVAADPSRAVVYFVDGAPDAAALALPPADELAPERVEVGALAVYQWCPDGISKSVLPAKTFAGLGPSATARNLRTVEKLVALLDA
jgi:uncharacterized protein (DUF1697 family)